jgi:hypothetical protein
MKPFWLIVGRQSMLLELIIPAKHRINMLIKRLFYNRKNLRKLLLGDRQ